RMTSYGAASFTYTANGELLARVGPEGTTGYEYDVLGNLRSVSLPDGTGIDYLVDARHRRIGRKVDGTLERGWLWASQLAPAAELDGTGQVVSRYVHATRVNVPDLILRDGATYRLLTDPLGSPRLAIDTTTGAVVQRIDYDEWGVVLLDTNPGWQPFGFGGGMYDTDTGLVRFGWRDYDPATGRWTSKDPILFGGGDANTFSYSFANPVSNSDPLGLSPGCSCSPSPGFWRQVGENFQATNEAIPGLLGPPGLTLLTSSATARAMETTTLFNWVSSGFRGATMAGATFTGLETGVLAGFTAAVNYVAVGLAFEVGVGVGSVVVVGVRELFDEASCPCPEDATETTSPCP
ncbi:MAG: RHS repeat-associated core domain-containing protein, partial [Thermoanaerobaculia bacterium]|nr:RHS repeat-associated core domain-containing protein [Thermoanaerobaculia bacterium]